MSDILPFSRVAAESADLVGGKGLSLALTASAGLPVPPGFCITTVAYRRLAGRHLDSTLLDALSSAYRELGGGVVAVRSSATAEDGAITSFAGQQETILGVEGESKLREAIERCWKSLHTDRARTYRQRQGVDERGLAMAVVVQRLVDAEAAGVLFTRDPLDPTGRLMRIEASWGLGEAVVSGKVTPDRYQVDHETGRVQDRQAGRKHIQITRHGEEPVNEDRQHALCLSDDQLAQLADLGRRVEAFYGDARDIEWAIADGRVWLLQARPITTTSASDRERVRIEIIEHLRTIAGAGGTVWSRKNLVEILPEPTPMTWAIVSGRLLSASGGTGAMYRDFGFHPDPALGDLSAYDLIAGRPYLNLSREPRLESVKPASRYPLEKYKALPHLALDPQREPPRGLRKWLGLLGMICVAAKITSASKSFAERFRKEVIPTFAADVNRANETNLEALTSAELVALFETWVDRTLVQFARHSLKPTLLAQFSWHVVEQQITKALGHEQSRAIVISLSQGARPDPEADLAQAIRDLAVGALPREVFLRRFGHRGPNEMELSSPRWLEDSLSLEKLAASTRPPSVAEPSEILARVAAEAKWNGILAKSMTNHVERLRTHLGLRETGKHHLMQGYAVIRRILLELDRRFGLEDGVFFLTPTELLALASGHDFKPTITQRRKRRAIELSLETPPYLFDFDLEIIGRPYLAPAGTEQFTGIALSSGVAEGRALVLTEPTSGPDQSGYILVCPSTDPAWVPLFVNASGLVMESGGTLSHGAIVAREFGLPAVAGLPGIQHRIKTGQRLRVDGSRGTVHLLN